MAGLPAGLTHPYDAVGPRSETYRHGYTFTWVRGERYLSVHSGRVANASRVFLVHERFPGHELLLGRRPVYAVLPAPPPGVWNDPSILRKVADRWIAERRDARQAKAS